MDKPEAKPFFSVIVPTLNEEKFFPRLLQNLAGQTTDKFEVIHVDGHSDDHTVGYAKKLAPRLPYLTQLDCSVRNVSHQRNLGASHARGKYLLFIDADTQLPSYFLEGLSYQLHRRPADTFTTWAEPDSTNTADKAIVTIISLGIDASQYVKSPIAVGVFIGCSRQAFKKIGGFEENTPFGEDENFVKTGSKKGLSFTVYRHPRFVYSLRRFRKEGTLPTIRQIAVKKIKDYTHGIFTLKSRDYQMGGHNFVSDSTQNPFTPFNRTMTNTPAQKFKRLVSDLLTIEKFEES